MYLSAFVVAVSTWALYQVLDLSFTFKKDLKIMYSDRTGVCLLLVSSFLFLVTCGLTVSFSVHVKLSYRIM